MKLKYYKILIIIIMLFESCYTSKEVVVIKGGKNEAIEIAVNNFVKSCKLRKEDKVYSINIYNAEILGLSISGDDRNKLFPFPKDRIGAKTGFPNMFIEREGKLFYWNDSTKVITKEVIDALSRYNHIDSTYVYEHRGEIPETWVDDSKKGADYYFCENNLAKYKRVITNISMGWYKPPKLKCE